MRALGPRLTPKCREALAAAGLDLGKPLLKQYTAEQYESFIRLVRQHVYGELPDEAAYRRLGERFVDGYFETLLGRALKTMVRMLGPTKTMERMPHSFESGTNYVRARLEKLGPQDFLLHVSDVGGYPTYTQGSLVRALEIAGAKNVRAEFMNNANATVSYHLRWTD